MKTQEIIDMFNLADEVAEFCRKRAIELQTSRHEFSFAGSRGHCGRSEPHAPHVDGYYSTVRFGALERYCIGTEGAGIHILVMKSESGSASWPSSASGIWWME